MFLVNDLNRMRLFRKTSQFVIEENCKDTINQVLYRASATVLSFKKISQYQHKCLCEYERNKVHAKIKNNKVQYISANSISIFNEVTPVLSSLRILQNLFITLLSKKFKVSLPSSMNDYQKKMTKYNIPDEINKMIKSYWASSGEYLKQLRDIDQHFFYLNEFSYMSFSPKQEIVIIFPDNPEIKSANKFKFTKKINGIEYLHTAFNEIHELYESLSNYLGFEGNDILFSISLKHLKIDEGENERTLLMLYQEDYEKKNEKVIVHPSCLIANKNIKGKLEIIECKS
jgi:hypothetical protein